MCACECVRNELVIESRISGQVGWARFFQVKAIGDDIEIQLDGVGSPMIG